MDRVPTQVSTLESLSSPVPSGYLDDPVPSEIFFCLCSYLSPWSHLRHCLWPVPWICWNHWCHLAFQLCPHSKLCAVRQLCLGLPLHPLGTRQFYTSSAVLLQMPLSLTLRPVYPVKTVK
ncbi:hypothetical protein QQF64_035643, partial [Cirrhinus molitorella]